MSDARSIETRRAARPGAAVLIAIGIMGLLVGVVAALFAMKAWTAAHGTTSEAVTTRTVTGFTPAQPLGVGEAAPANPAVDPTLLASREATLAASLTTLEARTAAVSNDAAAAGAEAGRAEALLIAFAARRAIDRGAPLGYLEDQLRQRFGQAQPRAVLVIGQMARVPVTIEDLRVGLDAMDEAIATGHSGEGVWAGLGRELGSLVILRSAGTPSPLPADRLERARRLLDGGQVEAARAEVARLPAGMVSASWMTASKRYLLARQALDAIENAAILGQGHVSPVATTAPASVAAAPVSAAVSPAATATPTP